VQADFIAPGARFDKAENKNQNWSEGTRRPNWVIYNTVFLSLFSLQGGRREGGRGGRNFQRLVKQAKELK